MFFDVDHELYLIFTNRKMSAKKKIVFLLKMSYNIILTLLILSFPLLVIVLGSIIGDK